MPDWIHAVFSYQDRGQKLQTNRDFLITLMLTGLRRAECESLLWSSIDLNYGFIISIDSNNGERHALPMGDYLFNLMKKRRANVTGEWVFPSAKSASGHMVNISKVRQKMNDACGVQFTLHDLRRIFGLIAESLDYGRYTIQHLLNKRHDDRDITAEHIQVSDQKLREAMNAIEDIVLGEYKFKHVCQ